ncbi:MAG: hypothetical protein PHI98_15430 [Eubacteriales bacterium]|nr:hypothetical protein [Eubacteriales bacterium]
MLREVTVHADWCEMTMSMMREKQFEACERRLFAHPSVALFSEAATDMDAQALFDNSYEYVENQSAMRLVTLEELRTLVLARLPMEAQYIGVGEHQLLEKLLMNDGILLLSEWDDLGSAEALISRLWCSFSAEGDDWYLHLPKALHEPILTQMSTKEAAEARERLFRYDATIHGLLYITGLLHASQARDFFSQGVMRREDPMAREIARRYLQASFEYISDGNGDMILLHPGLANPYQLVREQSVGEMGAFEMTQDMVAGGINGIFPEEEPLHEAMCAALVGALRPEYDVNETAEDLRILAKQGVALSEMESVLSSTVATLPTKEMLNAVKRLYEETPRWLGLKAALEH